MQQAGASCFKQLVVFVLLTSSGEPALYKNTQNTDLCAAVSVLSGLVVHNQLGRYKLVRLDAGDQ
jgi:hypothetical protein